MRIRHGEAARLFPVHEVSNVEGFGANDEISSATTLTGPGRFGLLFEGLTPFRPGDDALLDLARAMEDTAFDDQAGDDLAGDNPGVPAGFTYLGQFIDHDITFDKTKDFPVIDDPLLIEQARTPNLELDSVYGLGPKLQGELYELANGPGEARLRIGATRTGGGDPGIPSGLPFDLPRHPVGTDRANQAIIGDERNDENLIVSQTHVAFLHFHNKLMDELPENVPAGSSRFERAQQQVRWTYQAVVLHDFVGRLVGPALDEALAGRRHFFPRDGKLYMPLEFSVAAYRLGHSMIRQVYDYNRVFRRGSVFPGTLKLLFRFSASGGDLPVPSDWIIDWRRFYQLGDFAPNHARRLDTRLANPLRDLSVNDGVPSLAARNLLRGSRIGLPSGQAVAARMNLPTLMPDEIAGGAQGEVLRSHGLDITTPLWFYILREAEIGGGVRLGPVGARIVAEVFAGLLQEDPESYVSKGSPALHIPIAGDRPAMTDILRFVDNINPIGGA
jgi:hypothetical protein